MMRPTRREFAAAAAAFVLTPRLQRTAADSKPVITPPKDAFFRELAKLMEVTAVPGIAIAIVDGDKPIWQRTAGVMDAATKAPIGPDTLFPAASLGKPVAAYVALRLAADGKLDLDRPLKSYVPDHVPADPRSDKVTTRHVLSHTTGFRNWRNSAERPLTSDFEPGSRFQYSGEGFYYLQRAMEKIAGRGFDQLMQEQLFEPLSMRSATYAWRSDTDARLVTGHNRGNPVRGQNRDFAIRLFQYAASQKKPLSAFTHEDVVAAMSSLKPSPPALPNFMIPNAAGSLLTTVSDYCIFVQRVLSTSGGVAPLPGDLRRQMLSPQTKINSALSWGLGWGLETDAGSSDFVWHWGDNGNYKNFILMHLPSRSAALVFTNGNNGMRVCESVVSEVSGRKHYAFDWL